MLIEHKYFIDLFLINFLNSQVSGTDAPWRETANIKDGSNLTADMSVQVCLCSFCTQNVTLPANYYDSQNVIGDAMRGATWVSLHNGGGTGWGMANNGGFGLGNIRSEILLCQN